MVELKPWQRIISSPSEAKEGEYVSVFGGQIIASDISNPEYLKNREAKIEKKKAKNAEKIRKIQARLDKSKEVGRKIGLKQGEKEYKKSEAFKERLKKAYEKGLRDGKPSESLLRQIIAKKEKAQKLLGEVKKLETKV